MYQKYIKRVFDIVLSFLAILILLLPMTIIGICVVIDSKGPVFFKQKRFGIHKEFFYILKFRSMPMDVDHDRPTDKFREENKLSNFQKFIRRYSIDELPQIFNILAGQMSIIGPRPALWNQTELIALRDQFGANDVMPGLTGWAQINGRDNNTDRQKAELDGEYARNLSFWFDLKCFFGTIPKVLRHSDINEENGGTPKK